MTSVESSSKGFNTSLYLRDKKSFLETKELLKLQGRSLSEEISDFILRKLAELKGTEPNVDSNRRLQILKEQYDDLVTKTVKLERQLKASPHFQEAFSLLRELGLKKDLSNVDELVPKLMNSWTGDMGFLHQFINLMELARDKNRALQALTTMRSGPVLQPRPLGSAENPIVCEPEAKANGGAETTMTNVPVEKPETVANANEFQPTEDETEDSEEDDLEEEDSA